MLDMLKRIALFGHLESDEVGALSVLAVERHFPAGALVFEEDEVADDLWIVELGLIHIELRLPGSPAPVSIAVVRPDDVLGELALIDGHRRSAGARAVTDVTLHQFPRAALLAHLVANERVGFVVMSNLARIVSRRLRDTNLALRTTLAQQHRLLGAV